MLTVSSRFCVWRASIEYVIRVPSHGWPVTYDRRLFKVYLFKEQFAHAWTYTTEQGMHGYRNPNNLMLVLYHSFWR